MTVAHPWTVTVVATGDRALTDGEQARFDQVVTAGGATPLAGGPQAYGLTVVLAAGSEGEALELGARALRGAATRAGLPEWPISSSAAGDGPPGSVLRAPDPDEYAGSAELSNPPPPGG